MFDKNKCNNLLILLYNVVIYWYNKINYVMLKSY